MMYNIYSPRSEGQFEYYQLNGWMTPRYIAYLKHYLIHIPQSSGRRRLCAMRTRCAEASPSEDRGWWTGSTTSTSSTSWSTSSPRETHLSGFSTNQRNSFSSFPESSQTRAPRHTGKYPGMMGEKNALVSDWVSLLGHLRFMSCHVFVTVMWRDVWEEQPSHSTELEKLEARE